MNEGGQSLIESRAYEGLGLYMAGGPELAIAGAPIEDLQAWADMAAAWKGWHPLFKNRLGWLYLETGMATQLHMQLHGTPHPAATHEPVEWFKKADKQWRSVVADPTVDLADQSRAMLARGALEPYKRFVGLDSHTSLTDYFQAQLNAAGVMQTAYIENERDPAMLRGLYAQTFMLVLNCVQTDLDGICLPLPPRFQQIGNRNSIDITLWQNGPEGGEVGAIALSAQEQRRDWANRISLWPALLENARHSAPSGQGTLNATLEHFFQRIIGKANKRAQEHIERVAHGVWKVIDGQMAAFTPEAILPPKDLSLEDARTTYQAVRPSYHFGLNDQPRLEAYVRLLEVALANGNSMKDAEMLGWLYMELGVLDDEAATFGQAVWVFENIANLAEKDKNPQQYYEAKIAAATARLQQAFREYKQPSAIIKAYRQELYEVGAAMLNECSNLDEKSRRYKQLRPLAYGVATCLAVCCVKDQDHIATIPSPRQRGAYSKRSGCDILVIPQQDDDQYPDHAAGKVRFHAVPAITVDEGVATVALRAVHGNAKSSLQELLSTVTTVASSFNSDCGEASATMQMSVRNLREMLIKSASTVMF